MLKNKTSKVDSRDHLHSEQRLAHTAQHRAESRRLQAAHRPVLHGSRVTSTTNLRFVALILRWGKKFTSYNIFLKALSICKQHLNITYQKTSKGTIEVVDHNKKNKNQNPQFKSLLNRSDSTASMLVGKPQRQPVYTLKKSAGVVEKRLSTQCNNLDTSLGGIRHRLQIRLLGFHPNTLNMSGSSLPSTAAGDVKVDSNLCSLKTTSHVHSEPMRTHTAGLTYLRTCRRGVQEKRNSAHAIVARGEEACLYHNFSSLYRSELPFRQPEDCAGGLSDFSKTSRAVQQTSVLHNESPPPQATHAGVRFRLAEQRSLYSRRGASILPMTENFINKSTPSALRNPATYAVSSTTGKDGDVIKKSEFDSIKRAKEQDFSKIPPSVLPKKKNITVKNVFGVSKLERLTVGIKSVSNVSPSVETRKVRIGGATYAVPYVPHNARQEGLGIRWVIASASAKRQRSKSSWEYCLANVLADSLKNEGASTKKRDQSHQTAAANRAYTRYRWW